MPDQSAPWFAGRPGDLLVYRVNRRPIGEESLFPAQMPEDVYDHFLRMLAPGYEVVTGRRFQRVWRVGGVERDDGEEMLTGKLGWQPRDEETAADWSQKDMDWVTVSAGPRGHIIPFGFDGERRLLGVLREGGQAPASIAAVFEKILRENERETHERTTEWSVEPVLDKNEFLEWLHSLEHVRSVSFTAKLPNPEPDEEFAELWGRLQDSHATQIDEMIKSKREEGLVGVEDDKYVRQAVAMARRGFASLRGRAPHLHRVRSHLQSPGRGPQAGHHAHRRAGSAPRAPASSGPSDLATYSASPTASRASARSANRSIRTILPPTKVKTETKSQSTLILVLRPAAFARRSRSTRSPTSRISAISYRAESSKASASS